MTIQEYDLSELKKIIYQVLAGIIIVSAIHYKWNFVHPLFVQCFTGPFQVFYYN